MRPLAGGYMRFVWAWEGEKCFFFQADVTFGQGISGPFSDRMALLTSRQVVISRDQCATPNILCANVVTQCFGLTGGQGAVVYHR